jgi:hypothetical protein
VNNLRDLFASEFKPISSKPDSFLVWKQKTGSEHGLTFFIVDMDQIEVEDFVKGSISLEG